MCLNSWPIEFVKSHKNNDVEISLWKCKKCGLVKIDGIIPESNYCPKCQKRNLLERYIPTDKIESDIIGFNK